MVSPAMLQTRFFFLFICLLGRERNKPAVSTMMTIFPIWRVRFEIKSFPFCCSFYICRLFFYLTAFRDLDVEEDLAVAR